MYFLASKMIHYESKDKCVFKNDNKSIVMINK